MAFDLNHIPVPTWTEPATLDYLAGLARGGEFAVELGCYMGASARVMLQANPKLHLWTADNFSVFGTKQISELFLREWIDNGRCELVVGDSGKVAEILPHMKGKLDFVFVDDGHESKQVLADIRNMWPLLRPGGVMAGHDFEGPPWNDVALGVLESGIEYTLPVPRLWRAIKE